MDSLLVEVMAELELIAARAEAAGGSVDSTLAVWRPSVLERHGLSPADYDGAEAYYLARPDSLAALKSRVTERLTLELRQAEARSREARRAPPDAADRP